MSEQSRGRSDAKRCGGALRTGGRKSVKKWINRKRDIYNKNRKWKKFARKSSCSLEITKAVEKFPRLSTQQQCGPIIEQPVFG